jgi:hypothetical protein
MAKIDTVGSIPASADPVFKLREQSFARSPEGTSEASPGTANVCVGHGQGEILSYSGLPASAFNYPSAQCAAIIKLRGDGGRVF